MYYVINLGCCFNIDLIKVIPDIKMLILVISLLFHRL